VNPETILVTGAGGFVGSALIPALEQRGYRVRSVFRSPAMLGDSLRSTDQTSSSLDITSRDIRWGPVLADITVVIHLAGLAHVTSRKSRQSFPRYRQVNVESTLRLARNAARRGVKRFIYISSAKVHGDCSPEGKAFSETDAPAPGDAYAISKWKAEQALRKIEAATDMQVVIIRPPLIYGPGVKANFLHLLNAVSKGTPLPFAGVNNRRSFVSLGNVIDAIALSVVHEKAGGQTFLVADGEDLSMPELVARLARIMGKRTMLFPVPAVLARTVLSACGKRATYDRLWGSFAVDSDKIRRRLEWRPPVSVDDAIQQTVDWYLYDRR